MDISQLIQYAEGYLKDHQFDPHQLASFKYHMERLINEYATDIPLNAMEVHELIDKRDQFEAALKNANSLSNEVLIRHQIKEIEERILELTRNRTNRSMVG